MGLGEVVEALGLVAHVAMQLDDLLASADPALDARAVLRCGMAMSEYFVAEISELLVGEVARSLPFVAAGTFESASVRRRTAGPRNRMTEALLVRYDDFGNSGSTQSAWQGGSGSVGTE